MSEPAEPELIRTPDEVAPRHAATGPWPAVAVIAAIGALLSGGYWLLRPAPPAQPAPAASAADPPEVPSALGASPFPADVPPLDASDAFVRTWVPRLSAHPRVMAWLATDGLIRNFVTVVTVIAEGRTPAAQLAVLRPPGSFRVVTRGGRLFADDRTYARFDSLAEAVASLDVPAAAQLYATLKPRIEEAHRELGGAGGFDVTLERAIVQLLEAPVSDRPVPLEPAGIGYRAVDAGFDGLTGAQKQLLRMGAVHARRVQGTLRELAMALGIPSARLPAPAS